jgi:heat shock protein HslJ
MKPLISISVALFATLSMHNCGSSKTAANNKTENVVPSADSSKLFKYVFYASELKGKAVPDDVKAWLMFNIERVSGNTGCNSTSGAYELNGDKIAFKQMATTRRACLGHGSDVEINFMATINETKTWKLTETELILSNETAVVGKFKAVPLLKE